MSLNIENAIINLKTEANLLPDIAREGINCARNASTFALPRRSNLFVGASVLDDNDIWWAAGNVETLWQRSHHAEENAIMSGLSRGAKNFSIVIVSCPRKLFTPCGACCDLVLEFCSEDCTFIHDNPETDTATVLKAKMLMPYYPTRS